MAVPSVNDNDLLTTFDASVWAHRFVQRVTENPNIPRDEGAMLAWFAGAIMAGYDHPRLALDTDRERRIAEVVAVVTAWEAYRYGKVIDPGQHIEKYAAAYVAEHEDMVK